MKHLVITVIVLVLFLTSCIKRIDIYDESNFEPKLNVYGFMVQDSGLYVLVGKSDLPGRLDTFDFVYNADIELWENGNLVSRFNNYFLQYELWTEIKYPVYFSQVNFVPNQKYKLVVRVGEQQVSGETVFPEAVHNVDLDISGLDIAVYDTVGMYYYTYSIGDTLFLDTMLKIEVNLVYLNGLLKVRFSDKAGERNYYMLFITHQGLDYGIYWGDVRGYLIEDSTERWKSVVASYVPSEAGAVDMFDGPLPNVIYGWSSGKLFSDSLKDGQQFELTFKFDNLEILTFLDTLRLKINLFSVDKHYYHLAESWNKYWETSDLITIGFVEPVNLYSNLEGGLGAFVAINPGEAHIFKIKLKK